MRSYRWHKLPLDGNNAKDLLEPFIDGLTGGGLFTRLRRPGAPSEIFADEVNTTHARLIQQVLRERAATGAPPPDHSRLVIQYPQMFDLSGDVAISAMQYGFQFAGEGWMQIMAKLCARL